MFFRNCLIVGLLGCAALQSAWSQDVEPWSGSPAAAGYAERPYYSESESAVASPDEVFTPPESVSISRSSDLQQIVHRTIQPPPPNGGNAAPPAGGNCVTPGPGCADKTGCVPSPLTKACCDALLKHRHGIFVDWLYLSAHGVDLPYALPVDGLGPVNVLRGPAAIADNKYESGFRVGGIVALDDCTSIMATFWHFQSSEGDQKFIPGGAGAFYQATLTDPGTMNVAADSLLTRANYDIDFEHIDLVVRRAFVRTKTTMVNAVAGVRYAHLNQLLDAQYSILGETSVRSDIDFYGIGPRLGLEAEYVSCHGFLVYGNTHANFLAGTFDADYRQDNIFAGTQSFTTFDDTRLVTQLELELGLGWQSKCGTFRFTAGYYINQWYNAMTTPVWIRGVQSRQFENRDDRIGFNGLTVRAMVQF